MKELKMGLGRREVSADCMDLCGESEEDLRAMVDFVKVCERRGLKVNAGKRKDWGVRSEWTGWDWSICQNINIRDVF